MRDYRGPLCGTVRVGARRWYVSPHSIVVSRDPRMEAFFAARLRGEPVSLPQNPTPVKEFISRDETDITA